MTTHASLTGRRGSVLPLLVITIVALMGLIALGVDIGMVSLARSQAQNAADVSALSGARLLNGDDTLSYNIANSVTTAKASAANNKVLSVPITPSQLSVRTGVYHYNTGLTRFELAPSEWTTGSGGTPGTGTWTATEATVNVTTATYFGKVFGITSFPVNATATAVHRPRDIALILDFSGSMRYSSLSHWPDNGTVTGSLNPDPVWPQFGHWSRYVGLATTGANPMQRTIDYTMGTGENAAPHNHTFETDNGPPIIGVGGDSSKQYFLTKTTAGAFVSAWNYPQGGSFNSNQTPVAQPAPASFADQTSADYAGDKAPKQAANSAIWAKTAQEVLNTTNTTVRSSATIPSSSFAFDPPSASMTDPNYGYGPDFKGYSMGPGYWGKTFYTWPPDPRTPVGDPGAGGSLPGDWRKRFFTYGSASGRSGGVDDNTFLFDTSGYLRQASTSFHQVNYTAIIKWIAAGPKVLPDNLRAGRLLYYSAIPTSIPSSGGTLDQVFWRNYINYVLGIDSANRDQQTLYGRDTAYWGTGLISAKPTGATPSYMDYRDNPKRPRAHFWFGPLTMLMFLTESNQYDKNMWPGTCTEAQCWQLKIATQSALDDVKKNHPNDWLSLIYFSNLSGYSVPRVKLGKDYARMKNALWFPFTLLDSLGDANAEIRPYDSSFNYTGSGNVPNANGATCPEMGLKLAYNEFSIASGYFGRKGAAKMVVLETDGVPNTSCGGSFNNSGPYLSTYGTTAQIGSSTWQGNGASAATTPAIDVGTQITNLDTSGSPGYSTSRTTARIHVIAFGDLFETSTAQKNNALTFLTNLQIAGKTSPSGATSLESYKIVIGPYSTRIENLRQAFERIMQSGVQVTLIR